MTMIVHVLLDQDVCLVECLVSVEGRTGWKQVDASLRLVFELAALVEVF